MLTKTLLALNATLSQSPDTKQQASTGASECAGSMSSWSVVSQPGFVRPDSGLDAAAIAEESEDTLELSIPGVLRGDSFGAAGVFVSISEDEEGGGEVYQVS